MDTGYSGTPLPKKLGIKEGTKLVLLHAPKDVTTFLQPLPPEVESAKNGVGDVTLLFLTRAAELSQLKVLRATMPQAGALWACWPKKASGVVTDITEDVIRAAAMATNLVDVKVCAVNATWSGLKLVIPVKDRK